MSEVLNFSIGLLGHVDCGKTSLAMALSTTSSTASFDKNPQSQERGITIDLGFSSFSVSPVPVNLSPYKVVQFTLVDCPGHASLIRTIIGGSQIINIALLVIDITKGMETQTAECLVVAEITCDKMIIVLNKIDLLDLKNRESIIAKMTKKIKITLLKTKFKNAPILSVSANPSNLSTTIGISELKQELMNSIELPSYTEHKGPMVMAVDHCFTIRGQGTIFTGSLLEGCVSVNDNIEVPALQIKRKVKSIQIFRKNVDRAVRGDRIGLCVTQVDSKLFERGLLTSENYLKALHACVIDLNCIKYYKSSIKSKGKYHCSIGHDTVLAKITLFTNEQNGKSVVDRPEGDLKSAEQATDTPPRDGPKEPFDIKNNYLYIDEVSRECDDQYFALLEFEKPILTPPDSLIIGSKLDTNVHSASCRLAFHGHIQFAFSDKNYDLSSLQVYKRKIKLGHIDRIVNANELICKNLFGKNQLNHVEEVFLNFKVRLSSGESGVIENTFGKSGKLKIRVDGEISPDSKNGIVELKFRKFLFHKKKITQD